MIKQEPCPNHTDLKRTPRRYLAQSVTMVDARLRPGFVRTRQDSPGVSALARADWPSVGPRLAQNWRGSIQGGPTHTRRGEQVPEDGFHPVDRRSPSRHSVIRCLLTPIVLAASDLFAVFSFDRLPIRRLPRPTKSSGTRTSCWHQCVPIRTNLFLSNRGCSGTSSARRGEAGVSTRLMADHAPRHILVLSAPAPGCAQIHCVARTAFDSGRLPSPRRLGPASCRFSPYRR